MATPGVWTTQVPNQSPKLVIVSIVFFVISTIITFVRFGWRWAHRQRGLDDAMALCAYGLLAVMTAFGFLAAYYGFGKMQQDIKPTLSLALEYFYLYQICYKMLGGFTKLTFCFLYLRIFPQKNFARLVTAIAAIVALGSLAFALGTVLQCIPVQRAWNHQLPGTCIDNTAFWYSHAAFNTFFDIVVYVLPIPHIRSLKLARGQKTGLISIFSFGAFVIAASIVRMVSLRSSAATSDPTWGSLDALMWTEIEGNTSVICCCMPALRVPFLDLWRKVTGRGGTMTSTIDHPPDRPRDVAWADPNRGPHSRSYHPRSGGSARDNDENQVHIDSARGGAGAGAGGTSRAKSVDTWYEKVLHSLSRDKDFDHPSHSSSQEDVAKSITPTSDDDPPPSGLPDIMELGAIYKTTDLHVSTSDVRNVAHASSHTHKDFGLQRLHEEPSAV